MTWAADLQTRRTARLRATLLAGLVPHGSRPKAEPTPLVPMAVGKATPEERAYREQLREKARRQTAKAQRQGGKR